ncbi:MAG: multicopper oxidase family protein [Pseudomonadota bacterium]|nr:multicopper oxidase family protein [Pseudomonadota bacterium]
MQHRPFPSRPCVAGSASALALALLVAAPAFAADGDRSAEPPTDRVVADPVLVPMQRAQPAAGPRVLKGMRLSASPPPPTDKDPLLNIRLTEGRIYNPASQRFDRVRLRSYVAEGAPANPFTPFVAPTIQTRPGETVRVGLNNELAVQPNCKPDDINIPHCFNSTNLHSHGLWVSPSGNSDNVLITIRPKVSFEYEYNIPATHPAGTFWYHPHLHGSTALQVSSGMAGALIIHGDRAPTPVSNGDIDTLLRDETGTAFKERVVVFQQVAYACRENPDDPNSPIKKNPDGTWACGPDDVGTIENYDQLGFGVWGPSGRYTSINGQIMPRFADAMAGRVERWRNIHAGIRDSINLQFIPMLGSAEPASLRSLDQHAEWISQNCVGAPLTQFEIASDGLTHGQAISKTQNILQPGYRSDLLMVFPAAGEYCVIDGNIPADGSVSGDAESRRLLGTVSVAPGVAVGNDPKVYLTRQLMLAARRWMPDDMKQAVMADLERDLRLDAFVPHATITDRELTPNSGQKVEFNIAGGKFMVNDQSYDPATARDLILGNVEEWTLTSAAGSHPFHIHVNPFQVSRILDAQGVDVSVPGSGDAEYAGTKGIWKDTLFVKGGYTLYVRTRYQRYIGEYVLHCHILDHEDQGMMQNVRVLLPDGQGGAVGNGHH